jgi:tetratricopeptide (TPR) repeat protein
MIESPPRDAAPLSPAPRPPAAGLIPALLWGIGVWAFLLAWFILTVVAFVGGGLVAVFGVRFLGFRLTRGIHAQGALLGRVWGSMFAPRPRPTGLVLVRESAPALFRSVDQAASRSGIRAPERVSLTVAGPHPLRVLKGIGRSTLQLDYLLLAAASLEQVEVLAAAALADSGAPLAGLAGALEGTSERAAKLLHTMEAYVGSVLQNRSRHFAAEILLAGLRPVAQGLFNHLEDLHTGRDTRMRLVAESDPFFQAASAQMDAVAAIARRTAPADLRVMSQTGARVTEWMPGCLAPHLDQPEPGKNALHLLADPDEELRLALNRDEEVRAQEQSVRLRGAVRELRLQLGGGHRKDHRRGGVFLLVIAAVFSPLVGFIYASGMQDLAGVLVFIPGLAGLAGLGFLISSFLPGPAPLSLPRYSEWEQAMRLRSGLGPQGPRSEPLVEDPSGRKGRRAGRHWSEAAIEALQAADFARMRVAAGRALEADPANRTAVVCSAIVAGHDSNLDALNRFFAPELKAEGLSPRVASALGLALMNLGQCPRAAAAFASLSSRTPLLDCFFAGALVRAGNLELAVATARRAFAVAPEEPEVRAQFGRLLQMSGHAREACEVLDPLVREDAHGELAFNSMLSMSRALIRLGRLAEATHWAEALERAYPHPRTRILVAQAYEEAGLTEAAEAAFDSLCASGFVPEALIGLGRLSARAGETKLARRSFYEALDLTRAPLPGVSDPLAILERAMTGILETEIEHLQCHTWQVELDLAVTPARASRLRLTVRAPEFNEAEQCVEAFCQALDPRDGPLLGTAVWTATDLALILAPAGIHGHAWL